MSQKGERTIGDILICSGARAGGQILLPPGPVSLIIGRDPDSAIALDPLNDRTVGRQHARLEISAEGVVLIDMASRTGTFIDDQPIRGPVLLQDGTRFRLGQNGPLLLLTLKEKPIGKENAILIRTSGSSAAGQRVRNRPPEDTLVIDLNAPLGGSQQAPLAPRLPPPGPQPGGGQQPFSLIHSESQAFHVKPPAEPTQRIPRSVISSLLPQTGPRPHPTPMEPASPGQLPQSHPPQGRSPHPGQLYQPSRSAGDEATEVRPRSQVLRPRQPEAASSLDTTRPAWPPAARPVASPPQHPPPHPRERIPSAPSYRPDPVEETKEIRLRAEPAREAAQPEWGWSADRRAPAPQEARGEGQREHMAQEWPAPAAPPRPQSPEAAYIPHPPPRAPDASALRPQWPSPQAPRDRIPPLSSDREAPADPYEAPAPARSSAQRSGWDLPAPSRQRMVAEPTINWSLPPRPPGAAPHRAGGRGPLPDSPLAQEPHPPLPRSEAAEPQSPPPYAPPPPPASWQAPAPPAHPSPSAWPASPRAPEAGEPLREPSSWSGAAVVQGAQGDELDSERERQARVWRRSLIQQTLAAVLLFTLASATGFGLARSAPAPSEVPPGALAE